MEYYAGDLVECLGPDGPAVDVIPTNDSPRRDLSRALHRLVVEQGVKARDIVVLTARNATASPLAGKLGSFVLTESPVRAHDIKLASIYRFLGLESKVILVCDVPPRDDAEFGRLMYVAMSRARALLVVLDDHARTTTEQSRRARLRPRAPVRNG